MLYKAHYFYLLLCVTTYPKYSPCYTKRRCHSVYTPFWKPLSTLWGLHEIRLKISNLSAIACIQRPHSIPAVFTWRHHTVFIASMTACKQLLQCVHGALMARTQRAYSVLMAILAFKIFYLVQILSNHILRTQSSIFTFQSNFFIVFNSC